MQNSNEVKVGAFTLAGAALLAGVISFMGAFKLGSGGYELQVVYPRVNGLKEGNMVRYAGVQVGTVKAIRISPRDVEVVISVRDDIQIPQGSVFSIGADGIMSEKYVSIQPPQNPSGATITKGSNVVGAPGGGMDEFFQNSGDLVLKLERLADSMNYVMGDKEVQDSFKRSFKSMAGIAENMEKFTRVMADTAASSQADLQQIVQQINRTTAHMESILANLDNNGETGRNGARIAANLAETSRRMENIVRNLEEVATDPETKQALKDTVINVAETTKKARKMAGTFADAKFTADVSGTLKEAEKGDNARWRSNLGVTLKPSDNGFIYMGMYDIGHDSKFDFIPGYRFGNTELSAGAMQGEFGVGLAQNFGRFKLYSQFYDFNNSKVRLGGEFQINENLSIYGENMDLRHGDRSKTYLGARAKF